MVVDPKSRSCVEYWTKYGAKANGTRQQKIKTSSMNGPDLKKLFRKRVLDHRCHGQFFVSRFDACSTYKSSQINRARTCQISVKFMINIPIRSPGYMLSRVLLPNLNLHKDHNDNYKLSNLLRSTFPRRDRVAPVIGPSWTILFDT